MVWKVNAVQTIDTSNLVNETDYDTNIGKTENKMLNHDHDKCITSQEINKLTSENFAKLATMTN